LCLKEIDSIREKILFKLGVKKEISPKTIKEPPPFLLGLVPVMLRPGKRSKETSGKT